MINLKRLLKVSFLFEYNEQANFREYIDVYMVSIIKLLKRNFFNNKFKIHLNYRYLYCIIVKNKIIGGIKNVKCRRSYN